MPISRLSSMVPRVQRPSPIIKPNVQSEARPSPRCPLLCHMTHRGADHARQAVEQHGARVAQRQPLWQAQLLHFIQVQAEQLVRAQLASRGGEEAAYGARAGKVRLTRKGQ